MGSRPTNVDRVFVLGDIHGNVDFLRHAAQAAADAGCRTILQLGDFGALWPGSRGFFRRVDELLHYVGIEKLVFIDGNHEGFTSDDVSFYGPDDSSLTGGLARAESAAERDEHGFRILSEHVVWAPRGHRWIWNGVRFGALGGAFSVDWRWRAPGRSWWPDHEMPTDVDVERLGDDPLDVLVSHEVPLGVPLERISTFPMKGADRANAERPREVVRDAVEATTPQLVLHGHWHWRHGTDLQWTDSDGQIRVTRVEGLGADVDGDVEWASGVLDLREGVSFPPGPPIPDVE